MTNRELILNQEKNALKWKLNQQKNIDRTLYMIYCVIQNIVDLKNTKNKTKL